MTTTDLPARCGWCEDRMPATERVVFQHEPSGCWCEVNPANNRCHVSFACAAHVDREIRDLRELDFRVMLLTDVKA